MPIWLSLLIMFGAAIAAITSLENVVHEHRSGSLRPKLLFWVLPGWTSDRRVSPLAYWIGIAMDWFRVGFFALMSLVAAAYALRGFAAS
jgi:hypothetical protein